MEERIIIGYIYNSHFFSYHPSYILYANSKTLSNKPKLSLSNTVFQTALKGTKIKLQYIPKKMYEETGCFDPNSLSSEGLSQALPIPPPPPLSASTTNSHNSFEQNLKLSMEELSYHHNHNTTTNPQEHDEASAMELQLQQQQQQLVLNTHVLQDTTSQELYTQPNWNPNGVQQEIRDINFNQHFDQQQMDQIQSHNFGATNETVPYPQPTPDLLNLFHSASSLLPNSSISFANPQKTPPLAFVGDIPVSTDTAASVYDPLFHLNLPPQPPLFRDLFQSLPTTHGYTLPSSRGGSLFGGDIDHREATSGGVIYPDGDGAQQFDNGFFEFARDIGCIRKGKKAGKTKHFTTERERREKFNNKYLALKELIPKPIKQDRASVVAETIEYIKELLRTVSELKLLVEKKKRGKDRSKRLKTEQQDSTGEADPDHSYNNDSLRSSWLQRKSDKDTEVDVRIIDDEVTIKLVQKKKTNCLLVVSKVLDELQLDLHHVAGGQIGEHCSFLFNTKIYEGSLVFASAIANKLIEVVDKQCASTPPTNCY